MIIPHGRGAYSTEHGARHAKIPQALRDKRRWMGTRFVERRDGKTDKPPYRVVQGTPIKKADKTDPDNWATYPEALSALERGEVSAIGFVFAEVDGFFLTDLDGVVDPETGELDETASEIIHALNSYTEISCSGTGVHVIGTGEKPDYARCRSKVLGISVEIYDSARFAVLTGDQIGKRTDVEQRQRELEELCDRLWGPVGGATSARAERRASHAGVDDPELLERARRARTGTRFVALYDHGDTSRYASRSEADFALLNFLIFWTAGDRERIIDLFKASALYRDGKHRGYVDTSTDNALATYVGSFYKPRSVDKARSEEPEDPLKPYAELLLDPKAWRGRKAASAYKAYAGAVALAAEYGTIDDQGNLRIGCDLRRLAEEAGTTTTTLSGSALPYLIQEAQLLRWRRGKGRQAGVLVLPNPRGRATYNNKESTHFIVISYAPPKHALQTLQLLVRMRGGQSKQAKLLRLGMPAMFVAVALFAGGLRRGQNMAELADRTGRRKRDLRTVLPRLKAAGIVRELSRDVFRLTDDFAAQYERVLRDSGITYAEREQRRRHDRDRVARDSKLPTDVQPTPLRGKEHNASVLAQRRAEERHRRVEEEREKAGTTATTFLADELDGITAVRFADARQRWLERGGRTEYLKDAVHSGPWCFYREEDGDLYVRWDGKPGGWYSPVPKAADTPEGLLANPPGWLSGQLERCRSNPGLYKPTANAIAANVYGDPGRGREVLPLLDKHLGLGPRGRGGDVEVDL